MAGRPSSKPRGNPPLYKRTGGTKAVDPRSGFADALARLEVKTGYRVTPEQKVIGDDETFVEWCERLGREGMKVDGKPFRLDDRPAMRWIYSQLPSSVEEARGNMLVLSKAAQMGFTLMEMLYSIYVALKWEPCFIGMYLPDMKLAAAKSTVRFMPIIRTIQAAYERLTTEGDDGGRKRGEGNVMIRQLGESRLHFLWTSGKAMTESFPLDVLSFDEVQEMLVADMEKTAERLSGSKIKFQIAGSTCHWPDADIDYWFKLGQRWEFYTHCPTCGKSARLDITFPDCIKWDDERGCHRYICTLCKSWIDDPQQGEWVAEYPDAFIKSIHIHQMLSPTVTPDEIMRKWENATDRQSFENRVMGRPWADPAQIPVTLEMLNACVTAGREAGVQWKKTTRGASMGLDQMGNFVVAIIKERLPDGRQAVCHIEYIYISPTPEDPDASPWRRCDELMKEYGVEVCVVETLPNYDSAKSFARRHHGKVFLANYTDLDDEMLRWGDAPKLNTSERRTSEEARDRYTVTLDQYKCMQVSFARFARKECLFPDPNLLVQEVLEKGARKRMPVLRDIAFLHFTKTALVTEIAAATGDDGQKKKKNGELKKYRRRVLKVQIDPHTSYANMLCDVAWARSWGASSFMLPPAGSTRDASRATAVAMNMPGLPTEVVGMMQATPEGEVCGACEAFNAETHMCSYRNMFAQAKDPGCPFFVRV